MWSKMSETDRKIAAWTHLYMETERVKLIETKSRMAVIRDWGQKNEKLGNVGQGVHRVIAVHDE